MDDKAKMEPVSTLNSNQRTAQILSQGNDVEVLSYARPLAQAQPLEPRAEGVEEDQIEDDSFQRHMSVLDETIGS